MKIRSAWLAVARTMESHPSNWKITGPNNWNCNRKLWEEGKGEWEGKNAGDVYDAEHLCRILSRSKPISTKYVVQMSGNRSLVGTIINLHHYPSGALCFS